MGQTDELMRRQVDELMRRKMGRAPDETEQKALEWYLPEDLRPEEAVELFQLFDRRNRSRSSRKAVARLEAPEWWSFYHERVWRAQWGGMAAVLRTSLGLAAPLDWTDAAAFLRERVQEVGAAEKGAHGTITLPTVDGHESITVWTGDDKLTGELADYDEFAVVIDAVAPVTSPARLSTQFALLWLGRGIGWDQGTAQMLGASVFEYWLYLLCDYVPARPWLTWSIEGGNYYADNLTLHIPSIVATSEQVAALYEQARSRVLEIWGETGRPVPIAVQSERIRLVRFVEERGGRGPHDWKQLFDEWHRGGDDHRAYPTKEAMKAAYYQSVMPMKRLNAKPPKKGA